MEELILQLPHETEEYKEWIRKNMQDNDEPSNNIIIVDMFD